MPETFRLTSPNGHYSAEIIPELGAILSSLRYQNIELIDCPVDQPDWQAGFPSAVLYPFPNRTNQGQFTWNSEVFQLHINELERNHALHGLVWNQPFQVDDQTPNQLTCSHTYRGDQAGYPFPFTLELIFLLTNEGLTLRFTVCNEAEVEVPAAWGWHPYFTFSGQVIDQYSIQLPERKKFVLSENMIPVSGQFSLEPDMVPFALAGKEFDQIFCQVGSNPTLIELIHPVGKIACIYSENLPYFTLYTPPHRKSIAIEPQSAHIDALNNREGIWILGPKEKKSGEVRIQYTPSETLGETR